MSSNETSALTIDGLMVDKNKVPPELADNALMVLGAVTEQLRLLTNTVSEDDTRLGTALSGLLYLSEQGFQLTLAAFDQMDD